MTTRKAIAIAGLMLALALLGPASALAQTGGTGRPMTCTVSGATQIHTEDAFTTETLSADFAGVCSLLGRYTSHSEGLLDASTQDCIHPCTTTTVAANGDQITGTFGETTRTDNGCINTNTSVQTVTGGTGRFADASGTLTAVVSANDCEFTLGEDCLQTDFVTCTVFRDHVEGTITGRISY